MSVIKIEQVFFDNPPIEPVEVTVKHRKTSDPDVDGSYTLDSAAVEVQANGIFLPPFYIEGLLFGMSYTVKIIMNCDEENFVTEEITTPDVCPDVEDITGTTGGGNVSDQYIP